MSISIKVPSVGESVSTARISAILATSGSYVQEGKEIVELETDKVNQVLYAPASGVIQWNVHAQEVVMVGQVIGAIAPSSPPETIPSQTEPKQMDSPLPVTPERTPTPTGVRKSVAEFVDRLRAPGSFKEKMGPVEEKHTIQASISHTPERKEEQGVMPGFENREAANMKLHIGNERLTKDGVKNCSNFPRECEKSGQGVIRKKMSGIRRTIASRLVQVKNTTAMLTTFNEVDMTAILQIRAKEQEHFQKRHGVKLGFMSFFVKATVAALEAFPTVNSFLEGEDIVTFTTYDIGVAVSTDQGLFVPVVRHCKERSYADIESALEELAKKARAGSIALDDLKGGSFTITNGGVFGSLLSTPILNPPQSAILGMHAIVRRPVAVDDKIEIRPMMYLALSYDHRIIDGKEAVQFLVHIKNHLEDPMRSLLD